MPTQKHTLWVFLGRDLGHNFVEEGGCSLLVRTYPVYHGVFSSIYHHFSSTILRGNVEILYCNCCIEEKRGKLMKLFILSGKKTMR